MCIYYISPPAAIDGSWRQLYLLCIVYRRQQLLMAAGGDCIYLYVIMAGHHCILDVVSSHFLICISTSYQPSTQLSRKPTSQPFARPSRQPSGQPSVRPSTICSTKSMTLSASMQPWIQPSDVLVICRRQLPARVAGGDCIYCLLYIKFM